MGLGLAMVAALPAVSAPSVALAAGGVAPFYMNIDSLCALVFCIAAAAVFVLFVLMRKRKLRDATQELPMYMTPADTGYAADGVVEDRDVLALLMVWAHKGYISLHDGEEPVFVKVKDLSQHEEEYEYVMFNHLFRGRDEVRAGDKAFPEAMKLAKSRLVMKYEAEKTGRIFTRGSMMIQDIACMMAAFPAAVMGAVTALWGGVSYFPAVFVGAGVFLAGYLLAAAFVRTVQKAAEGRLRARWRPILFAMLFIAMNLLVMWWSARGGVFRQAYMWAGPVCGVVMLLFAPFMRRRTFDGMGRGLAIQEMRAAILQGEDREKPEYFYEILPYAYVMHIAKEWQQKWGDDISPPPWYSDAENRFRLAETFERLAQRKY